MTENALVVDFSQQQPPPDNWVVENRFIEQKNKLAVKVDWIKALPVKKFLINHIREAPFYIGRGFLGDLVLAQQIAAAANDGSIVLGPEWAERRTIFPGTALRKGGNYGLPCIYKNGIYRVVGLDACVALKEDLYWCRVETPRE